MSHIRFDSVTKRFGSVTAVDRFSLDVAEGEFVALVGPSGCGKTTTLRMLAGLEPVDAGRLSVAGRDVTGLAPKARNLAMVFQSYALYPHMSVGKNIGFSLQLLGMNRVEVDQRVREAAERLDIAQLLERRPKELSGGQRQRVAVARCIVREPEAFLFDEPLSNLDARLRATARVEIARLQKGLGITTLYVTHDQVEAMTMADRVVLMEGGVIRQAGAPLELYEKPRDVFVASFLGAPPMNLLQGHVVDDGQSPRFSAPGIEVVLPPQTTVAAGPATLGIRPEDLELRGDGDHALTVQTVCLHVEHLGAETVLRTALAAASGIELIARLAGSVRVADGTAVPLNAPTAALHLFDGTGQAVPLSG